MEGEEGHSTMIMKKELSIELSQVQHPSDSKMLSNVFQHPAAGMVYEWIAKSHMEEDYRTFFEASCLKLTETNAPYVLNIWKTVCRQFGIQDIPDIYMLHDYEERISLGGINTPFCIISSTYLQAIANEPKDMLYGLLAGQAAGIVAGHHKGAMLSFALSTGMQMLPIPHILAMGLEAVLNNWERCRYFTYDRTCYVVTGDCGLACRSIFVGRIAAGFLDRFSFESEESLYMPQAKRFWEMSALDESLQTANAMLSDITWLPKRYKELLVFSGRMGESL